MSRVCLCITIIGLAAFGCQRNTETPQATGLGELVVPEKDAPEAKPPQPEGFAQLTFKLVDKRKALQDNPALLEVKNTTNASDPWTAAAQSYFTLGSRASLLGLQHSIQLHRAEHDKPPAFEDFEKLYRQSGVQFKGLYPWQTYAYDDVEGTVCILEDRAEKKRMHEEKDVPYAEEEQGERVQ